MLPSLHLLLHATSLGLDHLKQASC
uniref:Uncharacterized protein n=1 Tax=Anguilla anguilla TaxID=7936 RepID=A0A0E9TQ66_ANGAN